MKAEVVKLAAEQGIGERTAVQAIVDAEPERKRPAKPKAEKKPDPAAPDRIQELLFTLLENDKDVRARVLPRSAGLLAPVELAHGTQASVSSSLTKLVVPRFSALSASATSADGSVILSDDLSDLKFE